MNKIFIFRNEDDIFGTGGIPSHLDPDADPRPIRDEFMARWRWIHGRMDHSDLVSRLRNVEHVLRKRHLSDPVRDL